MTTAPPLAATREAIGPTLIRLHEEGHDIVVADADLGKSTSARLFGTGSRSASSASASRSRT